MAGKAKVMYRSFRPDLEHPTREDATPTPSTRSRRCPVPGDRAGRHQQRGGLFLLASDERGPRPYVTGMQLRVETPAANSSGYDFHQ